jgi:cytochrome P450
VTSTAYPPPDIRASADARFPSGPRALSRLRDGSFFQQSSAQFLESNARQYGDIVHFRRFNRNAYQFNHPDLIQRFFLQDAPHHHRNLVMQSARAVLGHGLLTSEEPLHMRQRRLAQPAFLRDRIAAYGEVIGRQTLDLTARWQSGSLTDLHPQMLELALRIVGKCLFDMDQVNDIDQIASAVDAFMGFLPLSFLPFSAQIQRLPIPSMTRLRKGKAFLDALIYRLIAERRADPTDRGDLLSMLLNATDPEDASSANAMTDQQLHDECVTVILAGHETTANALSFAVHLIAHHPQVQQKLHDEAAEVLGSRAPTASDFARLPYAYAVFAETMRLFPPVWVTARTCIEEYEVAGFHIPAGATLMAPQYAVHRDPRFWPEPTMFKPERFLPEARDPNRPRYAFFPFAGGSRQCIAEGLAWMEGTLCLATIARDWRLTPPRNSPAEPPAKAAISLRPARGIPLLLARR